MEKKNNGDKKVFHVVKGEEPVEKWESKVREECRSEEVGAEKNREFRI